MNNLNQIKKEMEERFDEKFNAIFETIGREDWYAIKDIKSFIFQDYTKKIVEGIREEVERLRKRNDKSDCRHREPRGITADDYDCSDIHIGAAEAFSDVLECLREGSY